MDQELLLAAIAVMATVIGVLFRHLVSAYRQQINNLHKLVRFLLKSKEK